MNILPKGASTVILMTVIASTSILFFGSTVADNTEPSMNADTSSVGTVKNIIVNTAKNIKEENRDITKLQKQVNVAPPPGPYFVKKLALSEPKKPSLDKTPKVQSTGQLAPVAPDLGVEKPILKKKKPKLNTVPVAVEKPTLKIVAPLEELQFKRLQPSIPFAPTKPQQTQEAVSKPEVELNEPKLKKIIINEPSAPNKHLTVPALEKRITKVISTSLPERKVGALIEPSLTIEKPAMPALKQRKVVIQPNADGFKEKKLSAPSQPIRGKNSPIANLIEPKAPTLQTRPTFNGWKPPVRQQYIYVPMPVYQPNYGFLPIQPMNNGNFFAPIPNYRAPQISTPVGAFGQNSLQGSPTQNNIEIK